MHAFNVVLMLLLLACVSLQAALALPVQETLVLRTAELGKSPAVPEELIKRANAVSDLEAREDMDMIKRTPLDVIQLEQRDEVDRQVTARDSFTPLDARTTTTDASLDTAHNVQARSIDEGEEEVQARWATGQFTEQCNEGEPEDGCLSANFVNKNPYRTDKYTEIIVDGRRKRTRVGKAKKTPRRS